MALTPHKLENYHGARHEGVNLISSALSPREDPCYLWTLQNELLKEAEHLLGPRDLAKKIYQPSWDNEGPHIRYTPNKDGAFAELGDNAVTDWRMAVYQLAHETVHLLDQHGGARTNILEEGVAVKFALDMLKKYIRDNRATYTGVIQDCVSFSHSDGR